MARAGAFTVRVEGQRELARKIAEADATVAEFMRTGLLAIAETVARDVRGVYSGYSEKGAGGVKPKLTRPGNLLVAQSLRKSNNMSLRRRNFGPLMMSRAFLPAVDRNQATTEAAVTALYLRLAEVWK